MRCRLYLNKTQKKLIDTKIHMVHVYHNDVLHDIRNKKFCNEKIDEENPHLTVHFPDFSHACGYKDGMKQADFYKQYKEKDKRLDVVPASVFSNKNRSIIDDMIRSYKSTGQHPVEQWGQEYTDPKTGNTITKGIKYYTKSHPRMSFWVQIPASQIHRVPEKNLVNGEKQYKKNVFMVNIPKVGCATVRGWNKNIRFDEAGEIDFLTWCELNPSKQISCNIKKDKCGDYFITFSIGSGEKKKKSSEPIIIWKDANVPDERIDSDGLDVGEISIATLSDGTKFPSIFEHDPRVERLYDKIDFLQAKKSKAWGYANEEFLNQYRGIKRKNNSIKRKNKKLSPEEQIPLNPLLQPSKNYQKLQIEINKCHREIADRKYNYYHNLTKQIATRTKFLGIEGLKVSDMFQDKESDPEKTNRQLHNHNRNLSNASLYKFLSQISYKCLWYETIIETLDQYEASTKICSNCGHDVGKLDTDIREWVCPVCETHHDRDVNAAMVIKQKAIKQYYDKLKK